MANINQIQVGSTVYDIEDQTARNSIPTNLSSLTDDLGSSPVHTHSQYATLTEGKVTANQASSRIVTVTGSRALDLSDAGKFLMCNSSNDITITIPTADTVAFPEGTELEFCRYGSGALTFAPATGVTIRSLYSSLTAGDQYACVALKKLNTNVWILTGSLE